MTDFRSHIHTGWTRYQSVLLTVTLTATFIVGVYRTILHTASMYVVTIDYLDPFDKSRRHTYTEHHANGVR